MPRTARSVSMVSVATLMAYVIMLVRGFYVPRLLGPETYGLWGVFTIALLYAYNLHGGLSHAMNREVSTAAGAGDRERANHIRNTTMSWMGLLSAFAFVVALGVAGFLRGEGFDNRIVWCTVLIACIIPVQQADVFLLTVMRTEHQFGRISLARVVSAAVALAVMIALLPSQGLYAVPIGVCTSHAASVAVLLPKYPGRPSLSWDWGQAKILFTIGFPLLGITLLAAAFRSADRFVILEALDLTAMGYYGIALSFFELAVAIPTATGSVLNPQFNEAYGRTQDPSAMHGLLQRNTTTLGLLLGLVTGLGCVTLEFPIRLILPDYAPAIPVAQVLVIGGYFWGVGEVSHYYFVAIKRQGVVLTLQVITVVINVVLSAGLVYAGLGLLGVAIGTAIAHTCYGLAALFLGLRTAGATSSSALASCFGVIWPLATALIGLGVVRYGLADAVVDSISVEMLLDALRRCLIVLVCCAPALWQLTVRMRDKRGGLSA